MRVYQDRLKSTVGPEMEEVTGGCRKLHDEELNDCYSSPDICKVITINYV
jgi:hypothetical protein